MNRISYSYIVLRYVHDVMRQDMINVGILVYSKQNKTAIMAIRDNLAELKCVFPSFAPAKLTRYLRQISNLVKQKNRELQMNMLLLDELPADAGKIAYSILPYDESSLRWGNIGFGITFDLQAELESLYLRFVSGPPQSKRRSSKKERHVWKAFSQHLEKYNILDQLQAHSLSAGPIVENYDHTYRNGKLHCLKPISLDLSNGDHIENKVTAEYGRFKALQKAKGDDYALYLLVGSPEDETLKIRASTTLELLKEDGVAVYDESEAEKFARDFMNRISVRHA